MGRRLLKQAKTKKNYKAKENDIKIKFLSKGVNNIVGYPKRIKIKRDFGMSL